MKHIAPFCIYKCSTYFVPRLCSRLLTSLVTPSHCLLSESLSQRHRSTVRK